MFEGLPPRPSFPPPFPPRFPFPLPGPFAAFGQQATAGSSEGDTASSGVDGAGAPGVGRLPDLGFGGFGQAALERLTLLLNHVLAAEPEAMSRLAPHAGRHLRVTWTDWPAWLPLPASASWCITPPGLLDLDLPDTAASETAADLEVLLDARAVFSWALRAPLQAAGSRPPMAIQGDAELAAAVAWLADNLRWDIEDDLARVVGDGPAHLIGRVGRGLGDALQRLLAPLQR